MYDLNDINDAVFYVYAEGSTSGNVSLTRHEMFASGNVSHARIKSVGFNADRTNVLVVDVSGFSGTGTPEKFEVVAVEQSQYRTDDNYFSGANNNKITSTVSAGPREVFTDTIDLNYAIDASGNYTSPVDPDFEYVVLLRLVILDNAAYNDTTVLPANVGASTVFTDSTEL